MLLSEAEDEMLPIGQTVVVAIQVVVTVVAVTIKIVVMMVMHVFFSDVASLSLSITLNVIIFTTITLGCSSATEHLLQDVPLSYFADLGLDPLCPHALQVLSYTRITISQLLVYHFHQIIELQFSGRLAGLFFGTKIWASLRLTHCNLPLLRS